MSSDTDDAARSAGKLPPDRTEPPVKGGAFSPLASPTPADLKSHLRFIAKAHGVSVAKLTEPLPVYRGRDDLPPHVRVIATIALLDERTAEGLPTYSVAYVAKLFSVSRQSIHENKAFGPALERRR